MNRAQDIDLIVHNLQLITSAFLPLALGWIALQLYMLKLQRDILKEQMKDKLERRQAINKVVDNTNRIEKLESGK